MSAEHEPCAPPPVRVDTPREAVPCSIQGKSAAAISLYRRRPAPRRSPIRRTAPRRGIRAACRSFDAHANGRTQFPLACQSCPSEALTDRSGASRRWISVVQRRKLRFHPPRLPCRPPISPCRAQARSASAIPLTICSGPCLSRFAYELQAKFTKPLHISCRLWPGPGAWLGPEVPSSP